MRCGVSIVPACGVVVERVPWSNGKSRLTTTYQWFLAGWARRLSWKEVASGVSHHLGTRPQLGAPRRGLGPGTPRFVGRSSHRRRRDPMAPRPSLSDVGLSDRRGLQTTAVDRPRANRRLLATRPGTARRLVLFGLAIRVQRFVATVSQSAGRASQRRDSRPRPLPHHEATGRSHRRRAGRRSSPHETRRLRAACSSTPAGAC